MTPTSFTVSGIDLGRGALGPSSSSSSVARRAQRIGLMQNGKLSIRKDARPQRGPQPVVPAQSAPSSSPASAS